MKKNSTATLSNHVKLNSWIVIFFLGVQAKLLNIVLNRTQNQIIPT